MRRSSRSTARMRCGWNTAIRRAVVSQMGMPLTRCRLARLRWLDMARRWSTIDQLVVQFQDKCKFRAMNHPMCKVRAWIGAIALGECCLDAFNLKRMIKFTLFLYLLFLTSNLPIFLSFSHLTFILKSYLKERTYPRWLFPTDYCVSSHTFHLRFKLHATPIINVTLQNNERLSCHFCTCRSLKVFASCNSHLRVAYFSASTKYVYIVHKLYIGVKRKWFLLFANFLYQIFIKFLAIMVILKNSSGSFHRS